MKRDKYNGKNAEECSTIDWSVYENEVTIGDHPEKKKDEFDWDFNNVRTEWAVEFDESGRRIPKASKKTKAKKASKVDELEETIVSETLSQIASEDVYKADGAFVTGEIDAKRVNKEAKERERAQRAQYRTTSRSQDKAYSGSEAQTAVSRGKMQAANEEDAVAKSKIRKKRPVDEDAIRQSVDDKIVIRSEELKAKRAKNDDKKVKIRVKKEDKKEIPSEARVHRSKSKINQYKNLGTIPSKKKTEPSKFRKQSANWRYGGVNKEAVSDEEITETIENENFIDKLKSFSVVQYMCVVMAVVLLVTGVMTTAVYAEYRGEINKQEALAKLPQFKDEELVSYEDVLEETEVEMDEMVAEAEEEEHKILSLILSSVEKDLKIKLIDDSESLVKGLAWGVIVTDSKGDESNYEDEDQDGIIHLEDVKAGDYTVSIAPSDSLEGYTFPTIGQQVSVKAKIEYKVIANIKDEIKKESEVNVALEDPNGGKGADVETGTAIQDTVTWVESSQVSQGEEYEEATVDLSKTEKLIAFVDRLLGAVKDVAGSTKRVFNSRYPIAMGSGIFANRLVADNEMPEKAADPADKATEPEDDEDAKNDDSDSNPNPNPENNPQNVNSIVLGAVFNQQSATMKIGETLTLSIITFPDGAKPKSVEWGSGDSSIAEVSSDGKVKAVKAGDTYIYAMVDSIKVGCVIKVVNQVAEDQLENTVVLSGTNNINVGATGTIEAKCNPASDLIIEWKSLDEAKATVKADGNKAVVTGVAQGTVRIQATSLAGVVAYFDITVTGTGAAEYADDAQLFDSNKNKLYVYDNNEYRLAKYSDYKSGNFTKFYRKIADVVYTGWQTIDGLTYYFTENHEKVTGDQVIGGVTYHFGSDGVLSQGSGTLGIDVSKYQPSINWESVKASGINYVIIRCGYRGASTGALIQDPCFYSHIKGAKAVGLKVGVYFFSTALNEAEAVEEASMCAALCSGYGINYPIFIDVEPSTRAGYNGLPVAQRTANIHAFCSTIASAGYTPGLYANKTWLSEKINTSSLSCKIWLAQYNSAGPTYQGHYDLWQYTSKGKVDGISGNVDMNQSYLGY